MIFLLNIYQGKPTWSSMPYHDVMRTAPWRWRCSDFSPTFTLFDDLRREMTELEDGIRLLEMIRKGEAADKWSVVNDLAIYSGCIYVPTTSSLWPAILATAHGAGLEGIQKTLN
jgi:hypothetical protein